MPANKKKAKSHESLADGGLASVYVLYLTVPKRGRNKRRDRPKMTSACLVSFPCMDSHPPRWRRHSAFFSFDPLLLLLLSVRAVCACVCEFGNLLSRYSTDKAGSQPGLLYPGHSSSTQTGGARQGQLFNLIPAKTRKIGHRAESSGTLRASDF